MLEEPSRGRPVLRVVDEHEPEGLEPGPRELGHQSAEATALARREVQLARALAPASTQTRELDEDELK